MKKILFFTLVVFFAFGCKKKEKDKLQTEQDHDIIVQYIADHKLDAASTSSGLYFVIDSVGAGQQPSTASTVTVAYKGYLTDGTVFDKSDTSGVSFSLKSVIAGWTEGIPKFNEGGSGILLIPSNLGYGNKQQSSIPPNSVLIFDINLKKVN